MKTKAVRGIYQGEFAEVYPQVSPEINTRDQLTFDTLDIDSDGADLNTSKLNLLNKGPVKQTIFSSSEGTSNDDDNDTIKDLSPDFTENGSEKGIGEMSDDSKRAERDEPIILRVSDEKQDNSNLISERLENQFYPVGKPVNKRIESFIPPSQISQTSEDVEYENSPKSYPSSSITSSPMHNPFLGNYNVYGYTGFDNQFIGSSSVSGNSNGLFWRNLDELRYLFPRYSTHHLNPNLVLS